MILIAELTRSIVGSAFEWMLRRHSGSLNAVSSEPAYGTVLHFRYVCKVELTKLLVVKVVERANGVCVTSGHFFGCLPYRSALRF